MAGDHPPPASTAAWEHLLRRRLEATGTPTVRWRLIRAEGGRAVVEVDHRSVLAARSAWGSAPGADQEANPLVSRRTWGTLRGAKAWLRHDDPETAGRRGA